MTYQSTVLGLNPIAYWPCQELSGTSFADESGNDYHGTLDASAVLGHGGPIRTDAVSYGIGGKVGVATVDSGGIPTTGYSLLGWVLHRTGVNSMVLFLNGQPELSGSNGLYLLSTGGLIARINTGGVARSIAYDFDTEDLRWYMAVLTRSGNVARLYLDSILVAEITNVDTGDLDPQGSSAWYVGRSASSSAHSTEATTQVAVFDYALTQSQIQAIWRAAIPVVSARIVFEQRATLFVNTDQVIPRSFPFAHNFGQAIGGQPVPVREILTYRTLVNQSRPDYKQRAGDTPHGPDRDVEYLITLSSPRQRAWFEANQWESGETFAVPIEADWQTATDPSTAGTNLIFVDTLHRDYEVGSFVYHRTDDADPSTWNRYRIAARTDTQLQVHGTLADNIAVGDFISPARLAVIEEDSDDVDSHLADRQSVRLRFALLETELMTRRVTAWTPAEEYLDHEVYTLTPLRSDFLEPARFQIRRRTEGSARDYQTALDSGTPRVISARVLLTSFEERAEFLGWLDARQGERVPLWLYLGERDIEPLSKSGGDLTVRSVNYTAGYGLHSARRHFAFQMRDGTVDYKIASAAVDNGNGTETLTFPSGLPVVADIERVSFLRFVTLAQNSFELAMSRDLPNEGAPVLQCDFSFVELLYAPS